MNQLLEEIRQRAASVSYDQYGLDHAITPEAVEVLVKDRRDLLLEIDRLQKELDAANAECGKEWP